MYISCHSIQIKGTPLGEIDTYLVLRLTRRLVHIVYTIFSLSLLLLCLCYYIQHVFAVLNYTYELHFVTYIYVSDLNNQLAVNMSYFETTETSKCMFRFI